MNSFIIESSNDMNEIQYERDLKNKVDVMINIVNKRRVLQENTDHIDYNNIYQNIVQFNNVFGRSGSVMSVEHDRSHDRKMLAKIQINEASVNDALSYLCIQSDILIIQNEKNKTVFDVDEKYDSEYTFDHVTRVQSLSRGQNFIWNHNLKGENINIGIGDTGIDEYHSMFADTFNNNMNYNVSYNGHRKIYNYIPFTDRYDGGYIYYYIYSNGHGSHVSGIAAGNDESYPSHNISFLIFYNNI